MANNKKKNSSLRYDVFILVSLPKNSGCFLRGVYLAKALQKNGMKVKLLNPPKNLPVLIHFLFTLFYYLFATLIFKFKFGIALKPYPNTLLPLIIKKFISNIIIAVDIDDIDFGYRKGLFNKISRIIQKPFPKLFDIVTYHNLKLKDFILTEYNVPAEKLYLLLQGVDLEIYNFKKKIKNFKEKFCKSHNIPLNSRLIIYTAHLNIAADLDIILDNINSLLEKTNSFLIVAGGGPLLKFYKNYAKKRGINKIVFTGYLKPEEIVKIVLIADVAIVYYKPKNVNFYRASMKLREYLALKKRVVCNDVGELKYFKKYVYQSKSDINSFISRLEYVLNNNFSDKRELYAYKFIKENYNWETIGKKFKNYLIQKLKQFD